MVFKQRARKSADKADRRQTILAAGLALIGQSNDFTMLDVAQEAGIAKGTVYLYFQTKEQLILAILSQLLAEWFDEIDRQLAQVVSLDVRQAADYLVATLKERTLLIRLLSMLEAVLEHNIDYDTALTFKNWLLTRLLATGTQLEAKFPFLSPGEGAHILLHIRALLIGLWQMADHSTVISEVLAKNSNLTIFQINFEQELKMGITALLAGHQQIKEHSL